MNAYLILLIASPSLICIPKPDADSLGFAVYLPSLFLHPPATTKQKHGCQPPSMCQSKSKSNLWSN